MKRWCLLFVLLPFIALSQDESNIVEDLVPGDAESPAEEWEAQWQQWRRHPLDLNKASLEDLLRLPGMNPLRAGNLLQYREMLGPLVHINELQAVPGWNAPMVRQVIPYCAVYESNASGSAHPEGFARIRWKRKFPVHLQDKPPVYAGSGDALLLRFRMQWGRKLRTGFTADKDAGEALFGKNARYGFDHYGMHVFAESIGPFRRVALGDYTISLGQGAMLWQGFAMGKSPLSVPARHATLLAPYGGSAEYNGFRGVALQLGRRRNELYFFYSGRSYSAKLWYDSTRSTSFTHGPDISGLHRTKGELDARNTFPERVLGMAAVRRLSSGEVCVAAVHYAYKHSWWNEWAMTNGLPVIGRELMQYSVSGSQTIGNIHFFGEVAADKKGGTAVIAGMLLSAGQMADVSWQYRRFSSQYLSPGADPLREGTQARNEEGFYSGYSIRPGRGWQVDAYADLFRFPVPVSNENTGGHGYDLSLQATYTPSKTSRYSIKLRRNEGTGAVRDAAPMPLEEAAGKLRVAVHMDHAISSSLALAVRQEWLRVRCGNELCRGSLLYVEGKAKWGRRLDIKGRAQYFLTDDYRSRIYVYEQDIRFESSAPAFWERGCRFYITGNFRLVKGWQFSFKGAFTGRKKAVDNTVLAGEEELKMQVQCEF